MFLKHLNEISLFNQIYLTLMNIKFPSVTSPIFIKVFLKIIVLYKVYQN